MIDRTSWSPWLLVAALTLPASAAAQTTYPLYTWSETWAPLAGGTALSLKTGTYTDLDEGNATIALPSGWAFTYWGVSYDSLDVDANMIVVPANSPVTSCSTCLSTKALPDPALPNTFMAMWWMDMDGAASSGSVVYKISGTAPARVLTIEYRDWDKWSWSGSVRKRSAQLRIYESDNGIEFVYGPILSGTSTETARVGLEDNTGTKAVIGLACSQGTSTCDSTNWPAAGTVLHFGAPTQPDVMVDSIAVTGAVPGTDGGGNPILTITTQAVLRNVGTTAASAFVYDLYSSTVGTLDIATATKVYSRASSVSVAATSTTTVNDTFAIPRPAGPARLWIGIDADPISTPKPRGDVQEASESNNTGITTDPLISGVDLAGAVTNGIGPTGPGGTIAVHVATANLGIDLAGTVTAKLFFSLDGVWDSSDAVAATRTYTLGGAARAEEDLPVVVPAVPADKYTLLWVVDPPSAGKPQGEVAEADETNNVFASATTVTVKGAELAAVNGSLRAPTPPYPSTGVLYVGEPSRAQITIENTGDWDAASFAVSILLSTDMTITIYDQEVSFVTGIAVAAGSTRTVDIPFTMPTLGKDGVTPLRTGPYYVGLVADALTEIPEKNRTNNVFRLGPVTVRDPAMDFTVARVDVPSAAGVGEVVPVAWVIRNVGNRGNATAGSPAKYRMYLSVNDVISTNDVPLPIVVDGATKADGEVRLAPGGEARGTDNAAIPKDVQPGAYYIGAMVDPENLLAELDKANNAHASTSPIQIAESNLRVETKILPDGIVGVPYLKQFVASGGDGAYAWSLEPSSGPLPSGISVDAAGVLSGTPTQAGAWAFTVSVASAGYTAHASFVLRCGTPTAGLAVYTNRLPPAVKGVPYAARLAAVGGASPYAWAIISGALPAGLRMSSAGDVNGTATATGQGTLGVQVTDSVGFSAVGQVAWRAVEQNVVAVATTQDAFRDKAAFIGDSFALQLTAVGGTTPYKWALVDGKLPEGLSLATGGALTGMPTQTGNFFFTVRVTDTAGAIDEAQFQLTVNPRPAVVLTTSLPSTKPGEDYSAQLMADGGQRPSWSIVSGELPADLTLDARGTISGHVSESAEPRVYTFIVLVRTENGLEGMAALSIDVVPLPERPPPPKGCGCDASAGGMAFAAPLVACALRRRRRPSLRRSSAGRIGARIAIAAAVALLPGRALAGYSISTSAEALVELTGGTPLTAYGTSCYGTSSEHVLTLPFPLRFFGTTYTKIVVGPRGYIVVGTGPATVCSNTGLPSSVGPIISPWWDDNTIATGGVTHAVTGTSPRRVLTIQWRGMARDYYPGVSMTMQVRLREGSGTIEFVYGTATGLASAYPRATVGIADTATAAIPLPCTTSTAGNCNDTQWPLGQNITFSIPPDLVVPRLTADELAYTGLPLSILLTVANQGGRPAPSTLTNVYLSSDAFLDASDTVLSQATGVDLDAGDRKDLALAPPVPGALPQGTYYLIAKIDPNNAVTEEDKANNVSAPVRFVVGDPAGDLTGSVTVAVGQVAPGGSLTVAREVRNIGNLIVGPCGTTPDCGAAGYACDSGRCRLSCSGGTGCAAPYSCTARNVCDVPPCSKDADCPGRESCGATVCTAKYATYALYLSDNAVISSADRLLTPTPGVVTLGTALKVGDVDLAQDTVTVPAGTTPGEYWVGIVMDPSNAIPEISKLNNSAAASQKLTVASSTVSVTTTQLPATATGAPYAAHLYAAGGTGTYTWNLDSGTLPPGLSLAASGDIAGMATAAGNFSFVVKVTSGSASATAPLTLQVSDARAPLTVISANLPTAEFGAPYSASLVATGGTPPYAWSLATGSALPPGLALGPDGTVEGTPRADGAFEFNVAVKDSAASPKVASAKVALAIVSPASVRVTTTLLADGLLGVPYRARLDAAGGRKPYVWTAMETRRLQDDPTDVTEAPSGDPPAGLTVASDASGWSMSGTPVWAGLYAVTLRVVDSAGKSDATTLAFRVRYDQGVAIETQAVPDALFNAEYRTVLVASGGVGSYKWSIACPVERDETGAVRTCRQRPPDGLALLEDGTLLGRRALGEEESTSPQTFNFLVKVADSQNRTDLRAFSMTLRKADAPPSPPSGGCGCGSAGGASLCALLAVLGLVRRGRRLPKTR